MKRLALLLACLLLTGCMAVSPDPPAPEHDPPASRPIQPPIEEIPVIEEEEPLPPQPTAEELFLAKTIGAMSLEEKVGQLFFVRCPASGAADAIERYHLGGVLLFTSDYRSSRGKWLSEEELCAKLEGFQAAARLPLFIGSDEEGGTVTRATRDPLLFPEKARSPQEYYALGGMERVLQESHALNTRLRALGVNVNFAPVADVSTDPSDFIHARSFGAGAQDTAEYIDAVVREMNDSGVACVLKHFPGYGPNADTHTGSATDARPYAAFETGDLIPFAAGIEAGAPFVLVSHNRVLCMDPDLPASLSPEVHRLLREELAFEGVVLTDDLDMAAAKACGDEVAVLALLAGNDMLVTAEYPDQIPQVIAAVRDGTLAEERIDASVERILRAKLALGLLTIPGE